MPHADEGQIHAYLDRQGEFADPVQRRELGKHIADCSSCTRALKEARRLRVEAEELLRTTRVREVHAPPFAEIAARAQSRNRPAAVGVTEPQITRRAVEEKEEASTQSRRRQSRVWRSLAWAATIILAIGVGWGVRPLLMAPSASSPAAMGFEDSVSPEERSASSPESEPVELAESMARRRETPAPAAPTPPAAALADEDAAAAAVGRIQANQPRADSERVTLANVAPSAAREVRSSAVDSLAEVEGAPSQRQMAAPPVPTRLTRTDSGLAAADTMVAESVAERDVYRAAGARDSSALADAVRAQPRGGVASVPLTFESDRSRLPGDWDIISREEAERILDGPLVWVPELRIVGLARTQTGNGVRLMQSAGSGALLELEIRAIVPPRAGDPSTSRPMRIRAMQGAETNASTGTATIGRYLITAKAGFPEASLRRLLQDLTYAPAADQLRDH